MERNKICVLYLFLIFSFLLPREGNGIEFIQKNFTYQSSTLNITNYIRNELKDPKSASSDLQKIDKGLSLCGNKNIDIREITINELQNLFNKNDLNSTELTHCYLNRIKAMNPYLNAVIEINPDAIRIANEIDIEKLSGKMSESRRRRSHLYGIPILIKDNIGTRDQMETTTGSLAFIGLKPKKDAHLIRQLREAGAIILGKSTLSEFAFFRGTGIPSGWSGRGGQTLSPYSLAQDASGSSSGSAVSVTTNLCVVSIGTETDGSIVTPSSRNSVVAMKPTVGRVPTSGVIPISFNQDSVGPFGRTVEDAAILFQYMDSVKSESYSLNFENEKGDYSTVGVLRNPFWNISSSERLQKCENVLKALESGGVRVKDPVIPAPDSLNSFNGDKELIVLLHDFKWGINEYLANEVILTNESKIKTLSDIIQFNNDHPSPENYNQVVLKLAQLTDGLQNQTYLNAREENREGAKKFLNFIMETNELDAIIAPTENNDESHFEEINTSLFSIAAIAGYPVINVPVGIHTDKDNVLFGMPFGISFVGLADSEWKLFKLAHILEKKIKGREIPQFIS